MKLFILKNVLKLFLGGAKSLSTNERKQCDDQKVFFKKNKEWKVSFAGRAKGIKLSMLPEIIVKKHYFLFVFFFFVTGQLVIDP